MSTTVPMIWMTRPVAAGAAVAIGLSASSGVFRQRAWAPDAMSSSSLVMLAWRTLL